MSGPRLAYATLFAVTLAVYLVMVIWSLPRIAAEAGGLLAFDLRPTGYGLQDAQAFLSALSPRGNSFYLGVQHRLDLAYPGLLALTLAIGFWHLSRGAPTFLRIGLLVPAILSALFDYLENARVAGLLNSAAAGVNAEMVDAASLATVLKSLFGTIAIVSILGALALRGWRRWRGGRALG
jgi:hypothetical protein